MNDGHFWQDQPPNLAGFPSMVVHNRTRFQNFIEIAHEWFMQFCSQNKQTNGHHPRQSETIT